MELTATSDERVSIAAPTAQKERIVILDSLRGLAILGILLMNIPSFGFPGDPFANVEAAVNFNTWYFINLIPHGTQRALFSMLFGAGIILFVTSAAKKADGIKPADYFFRRQLWLVVFSLFDVFILLWDGDILLDYALWGMVMFTFRNLSPKSLLIAAAFCLLLMLARENRDLYKDKKMIARGETVAALDTTRTKLSPKQTEEVAAMKAFKDRHSVEKRRERIQTNLRKTGQSDYETLYEFRTNNYLNSLVHYMFFELWDVLLFMFLGMAFFKMGILTGQAPAKVYWWVLIVGLGLGIFLSYLYLQPYIKYQFNRFEVTKNVTIQYYQLARVLRSIGIFGAIMLLYKSGAFKWLFLLMRPVGQMAFTNYLMQSLLCGIFFYSIGFAMYGKLQRHEIYNVVGVVWLIQIIYSHIWLHYFRFGPFEWAWRSLTYWKVQPMRKEVHKPYITASASV